MTAPPTRPTGVPQVGPGIRRKRVSAMSSNAKTEPRHDFIPARDVDLVAWSANFRDFIVADPGAFGLTPAQAAAYSPLHDAYAAGFTAANTPSTNSRSTIVAKNQAKKALKAEARKLARIVQATPGITDGQRSSLGLTVPDPHLTPIARPGDPPVLSVLPSLGRTVRIRLRDKAAPNRLGKPPGVAGAVVLYYVGSADEQYPPAQMSRWSFLGNSMRTVFAVTFPPEAPAGAKVWITTCWFNTRGQNGPFSSAALTRLGDGVGNFAGGLRRAA
jgi:hypothetical protein